MKFSHVGLTCADLDRSEKFYSELFGFRTFFRIRRKTPWLDAQVGYKDADIEFCHMRGLDGLHLELLQYHHPHATNPLPDDTYRPGNMHISIHVEDAEETINQLVAWRKLTSYVDAGLFRFAGRADDLESATVTDGPNAGSKGFYMRDPDGHSIEIIQPAPFTKARPGEARTWFPPLGSREEKELAPELSNVIDQIQETRSRNNVLWMDIVRLVYRSAPDEAKAIFREIEKNDAEIVRLGKESASL